MFSTTVFITLVICGSMIIFGLIFVKCPPKDINGVYGYRTAMSSKNQQTWDFAHLYSGKVWLISGIITLIISFIIIFLFKGSFSDKKSYAWLYMMIFNLSAMLIVVPLTEYKLRQKFDKDGREKK